MVNLVLMGSKSSERGVWSRTVAAQVRAERAARSLSQKDVIDGSGLSRSTYLRLEAGERVADTAQLAAILAVFGMPFSEFMRRVEERIVSDMKISPEERDDLHAAIARNAGTTAEELTDPCTDNAV